MSGERVTTAAGGIVWRKAQSGIHLLVIHRPSYDDWTFPKGKTDRGETLQQTAVREIAEETGLKVRLGHPLSRVDYDVASGRKHVSYWIARSAGNDASDFAPNKEVDEVRWVRPREAAALLSYDHDRDLLDEFRELRDRDAHRTRTLIVLRHGTASSRDTFDGDDVDRPLTKAGQDRSRRIVPLLDAYGVRRVVSSPAVRCAQTVEPYADSISTFLEIDDRLSEDTRPGLVRRSVDAIVDRKKPVVLCSHRPTLPWIFDALGIAAVNLAPGEGVVVHHRKGEATATEPLLPPVTTLASQY